MSLRIFVIAGEESGDILGASILSQFPGADIHGIGGTRMIAAGLKKSLFPMEHLSVMGIAEILPKLFFFKKLIDQTVAAIEECQPDLILSIDSPDFCFRVQRAIKKRGKTHAKQIHVVAPSVWAWRPGRAKRIATFLDGLICLFPFEPPYFTAQGLRAISIGHPSIDGPFATADGSAFRAAHAIAPSTKLIGVYPGSRARVMRRHLPLFINVIKTIAKTNQNLHLVFPTFDRFVPDLQAALAGLHLSHTIVTDTAHKPAAMRACDAALSVTGTIGLELVIADVPHVAAYRMNAMTWMFVKALARTKFAHLANILAGRLVVPEFLQAHARVDTIAPALSEILRDGTAQKQAFAMLRAAVGQGAPIPAAQKGADFIRSIL